MLKGWWEPPKIPTERGLQGWIPFGISQIGSHSFTVDFPGQDGSPGQHLGSGGDFLS